MKRRTFLARGSTAACALAGWLTAPEAAQPGPAEDAIMTIEGPVPAAGLGVILPHEHVMSNFGAEPSSPAVYDEEALQAQVVPYLRHVRALGCGAIVDCTTDYFGRHVRLLRRLSAAAQLPVVTNTGWYGGAADRYVPRQAFSLSADEIARLWVAESREGIDGTGIRPGFIKLAVDPGPLSAIDRTLVLAGIKAHRETGLVLAVHTGNNVPAAMAQIDLLAQEGVSPRAWIWTHAHEVENPSDLIAAARAGAWISLDGLSTAPGRQDRIRGLLDVVAGAGFLSQVLLSHDGNAYPRGGPIRPFDVLFTDFIPALERTGYRDSDIRMLTRDNPGRAFALGPARLSG
jgi:predicted metal-dependent phosphotriesterase family hydrolase